MNMLLVLFLSFAEIGLLSVGGGYVAIPLIQRKMVDDIGLLTLSEFTDLVTIAEMTPGPIALNAATFVGLRAAGPLGAVFATLGNILPSVVLVSLLFMVYQRWHGLSLMQSVLASLRPAVVALIASAMLSILSAVVFGEGGMGAGEVHVIETGLFLLALILLRTKKLHPIAAIVLCGAAELVFAAIGWI